MNRRNVLFSTLPWRGRVGTHWSEAKMRDGVG
jgi:hypothetical protein